MRRSKDVGIARVVKARGLRNGGIEILYACILLVSEIFVELKTGSQMGGRTD